MMSAVEPGTELVILVDERDQRVGVAPKMAAHVQGLRHRAFSVFVFNDRHELLLQKRASEKYHSGGLWTNTACGHPRPGEQVAEAIREYYRYRAAANGVRGDQALPTSVDQLLQGLPIPGGSKSRQILRASAARDPEPPGGP